MDGARNCQLSKRPLHPRSLDGVERTKLDYTLCMRNEFTAIIERDGEWFVGWSPEIPGANGQGRTLEVCRQSLGVAIQLISEDRRMDSIDSAGPA